MQEKQIHRLFVASVLAKGVHALVEIVSAIALALIGTARIEQWLHPYPWVARHFDASDQQFYEFYLLSHGVIKAVLVYFLLREKLWAYPAGIAVFGLFILYQLYRYSFTHDPGLILLSLFDLFVIYLAVHEYRLLRKHLPTH